MITPRFVPRKGKLRVIFDCQLLLVGSGLAPEGRMPSCLTGLVVVVRGSVAVGSVSGSGLGPDSLSVDMMVLV